MNTFSFPLAKILLVISYYLITVQSFSIPTRTTTHSFNNANTFRSISYTKKFKCRNVVLLMSDDDKMNNNGVVELVDDEEEKVGASPSTTVAAPFLSQGEIQKEALELSNDPKQTRVIIYIIISLVPVLFLVPLMLGSRDLIPLDALPPVELN